MSKKSVPMTSVAAVYRRDTNHSPVDPQHLREKIRIGMEIPTPNQQDQTLEHRGESYGQHDDKDQWFADQRPEKDPFDQYAEEKTADECQKKREKNGKFCPGDEGEKKIGADREQFAMGEIEHAR